VNGPRQTEQAVGLNDDRPCFVANHAGDMRKWHVLNRPGSVGDASDINRPVAELDHILEALRPTSA
jgi:hypothetical protein